MANVLKKLPRVRSRWPAQVKLTKSAQFNLYDGETVAGVITLNAGTTLRIVDINLQHAIVRVGSAQSPLPVTYTDIIATMGGTEKILALPDDAPPKPEAKEPAKR